jgi:glycosyltransferase involved in cell wall biosynthesis
MNVSIITPIYNEEKNILKYLQACEKIQNLSKDSEIILINDGSNDKSLTIIKSYEKGKKLPIKLINFKKNQGRLKVRIEGAKKAKNKNLLFIDAKCLPNSQILREIQKENYEPISGNVVQKEKNTISRFFFLIRLKLYKNFFGNTYKKTFINKDNFDKIPKGTGILFIDKDRFLNNQPENKSKNSSDDTALFWNIVKEKDVLKSSKVKITYNTRNDLKSSIKHLYERGPKFTDYYYKPSKAHFWLINSIIISLILSTYTTIKHEIILEMLIIIFVLLSTLCIYLSQKIKDFFILISLFPILSLIFFIGIIKGIILKIARK